MKKRILRITGASLLGFTVFIVSFITYSHLTHSEPKYTLREALWVSDRDMKHFYPPFSMESQNIIKILEETMFDTDKKAYNGYVLYRVGFTTNDKPIESILIFDFQPPKQ